MPEKGRIVRRASKDAGKKEKAIFAMESETKPFGEICVLESVHEKRGYSP